MNVTRLLAKHGSYKAGTGNELTDSYTYETWVPQLARYATMQQNFSQFPVQVRVGMVTYLLTRCPLM